MKLNNLLKPQQHEFYLLRDHLSIDPIPTHLVESQHSLTADTINAGKVANHPIVHLLQLH